MPTLSSQGAYAVLRQGGTQPSSAMMELGLTRAETRRFETAFRARLARRGEDAMVPKFARHDDHAAAVLAAGGYPALTERRCGLKGAVVGLPLLWPQLPRI